MDSSEKSDETEPRQQSPQFNEKDAEVTFISSDGVLFKIHLKNLETNTKGFPPSGFEPAPGEETPLQEDSETLKFLFSFIYPRRHPTLDSISSDLLLKIADAAEKYEVFAAINVCLIRLRTIIEEAPLPIFLFGFKYDYPDLMDVAAPLLHDIPLMKLLKQLPQRLVIPWVAYHERWRGAIWDVFHIARIINHPKLPGLKRTGRCDECKSDLAKYEYRLYESLRSGCGTKKALREIVNSKDFGSSDLTHLTGHLTNLEVVIEKIVDPPAFTIFM